jgi:hypothetical protein
VQIAELFRLDGAGRVSHQARAFRGFLERDDVRKELNSAYPKSFLRVCPRNRWSASLGGDSFLQLANVFQFFQCFLQGHKLLLRQHNKLTFAVLAQNFRVQVYHKNFTDNHLADAGDDTRGRDSLPPARNG